MGTILPDSKMKASVIGFCLLLTALQVSMTRGGVVPQAPQEMEQRILQQIEKFLSEKLGNVESSLNQNIEAVNEKINQLQDNMQSLEDNVVAMEQKSAMCGFVGYVNPAHWTGNYDKVYTETNSIGST